MYIAFLFILYIFLWLSHVVRSCAYRRSKGEVTVNNAL